jgi:hypothetical protein
VPVPEQIEWLNQQFEALLMSIKESRDSKERQRLLRQMKIVIKQIDSLILPKEGNLK